MATFENTVTIQRPVEDVFAFLADFENVPTWNYAILAPLATSRVKAAVAANLDTLKQLLESGRPG